MYALYRMITNVMCKFKVMESSIHWQITLEGLKLYK